MPWFAALDKTPKVKGVDEARCSDLVRRDQTRQLARSAENDARMMLVNMAKMVGVAFRQSSQLCPSAEPTPPSVEAVATPGGLGTTAKEWGAKGWKCLQAELWNQPVRWQYELRSNPAGGTFEIVARGRPVVGGPQEELYLTGIVDAEGVAPPGAVKRR